MSALGPSFTPLERTGDVFDGTRCEDCCSIPCRRYWRHPQPLRARQFRWRAGRYPRHRQRHGGGPRDRAIAGYLQATGARPQTATLAIAGPIEGDDVALTNRDRRFRRSELASASDFPGCGSSTTSRLWPGRCRDLPPRIPAPSGSLRATERGREAGAWARHRARRGRARFRPRVAGARWRAKADTLPFGPQRAGRRRRVPPGCASNTAR